MCAQHIDECTFYHCEALQSIQIPVTVIEIGKKAFANCTSLAEITYDGTVEQWNEIVFGEEWHGEITLVVHCDGGDIEY